MSRLRYRPELDGLRALAVLPVLLYHARLPLGDGFLFKGGYLGVDVFFVISGYLITALIWKEWSETGAFSYRRFYERRVRRLLPILFLVVLATLVAGWKILMPAQMIDFTRSALASLGFVSNVYWWSTLFDYGATSSLIKPLVHTWSLAVEEQFYLVFPALFLLLLRRGSRFTALALAALVVAGLLAGQAMTWLSRDWAFFMLPARAWELGAGAVLAMVQARGTALPAERRGAGLLAATGVALIILAYVFLPYGRSHPGFPTVVPVVGTLLFIAFAGPGNWVGRLASWGPVAGIGLVSYSLYIWHYPIFALFRLQPGHMNPKDWVWPFALTFVLSIAGYFLVEKPCRDASRVRLRTIVAGLVLVLGIMVAVFVASNVTRGLPQRLPELVALYGKNQMDNELLRDDSWAILDDMAAEHGYGPVHQFRPTAFESEHLWFSNGAGVTRVLVVGNSHAKDVFNALWLNRERFPGMEFARYAMANASPEALAALDQSANFQLADVIIYSIRKKNTRFQPYLKFKQLTDRRGKQFLVTTTAEEFRPHQGMPLFDGMLRSGMDMSPGNVNRRFWARREQAPRKVNASLRQFARQHDIDLLDKTEYVCNRKAKTCDGVTPEGYKTFYDYGHYTIEGATYFGERIAELGWLDEVREE
ncbi:acyltransferase family protein [Marinihelvus fidelis]|uniref:acyltransferase family protein n=1 Tax=Marinihelvus fidelis TaxID=2613842 RepID=UPI0017824E71|nr:acyltransferase family protein [Marinihelvus fidelis]